MPGSLRQDAKDWCAEDRNPWPRAFLLAWGVWVATKILRDDQSWTPIGFLNFGIHELGHIIFMPLGEWMGVLGGSLFQCLVPVYGIWQFLRQRDYFAAVFCLSWLAESLLYISAYIADARDMELPLVSPFGGDLIHDWNYLLSSLHWLGYYKSIALKVRGSALVSELAFLYLGSILVWWMFSRPRQAAD